MTKIGAFFVYFCVFDFLQKDRLFTLAECFGFNVINLFLLILCEKLECLYSHPCLMFVSMAGNLPSILANIRLGRKCLQVLHQSSNKDPFVKGIF
jgi:hypothetical protein